MKAIKKINQMVTLSMIAVILMFTVSCKKENSNATASSTNPTSLSVANNENLVNSGLSPWQTRSSGISVSQRGIIDMSEPDQTTCYGIIFDGSFAPTHDLTVTHDGGATWHSQTIAGLENNYLLGVAATTAKTVHIFGWNYVNGGGNILSSTDGGITWQREGANAYADPASFPDAIEFFDPENGIIFGDPENGSFEIYTTGDGGKNWSRVPSNKIPAPEGMEFGTAYITDTYLNTIWTITVVVDNNFNYVKARLLQSDDKGLNWYVRNSSLPFIGGDGTIKFSNHSTGLYKNNGVLYRTTDGGTTFNVVTYSGTWFSFDFDNVPGKAGWWISTGGGPDGTSNSLKGIGSSISYDDGDHWVILDTAVNHTCIDMTSPTHGYSGGITSGSGNDGVFDYSLPPGKLP